MGKELYKFKSCSDSGRFYSHVTHLCPPKIGWVKLNIDEASSIRGSNVVFRDSSASCLSGFFFFFFMSIGKNFIFKI